MEVYVISPKVTLLSVSVLFYRIRGVQKMKTLMSWDQIIQQETKYWTPQFKWLFEG